MELWQMDIVGGVRTPDGSEAKIVSGIDDHCRFVISAAVVARATARPVCDALEAAIEHHGTPEAVLTDNAKAFTARVQARSGRRVPPFERFKLAAPAHKPATPASAIDAEASTTRRVSPKGTIGFATVTYKAGAWLAGQSVEVSCDGGLVQLWHRGVLNATHARRHPPDKQSSAVASSEASRPTATVASVTRKVDSSGNVCFAGMHLDQIPAPGPFDAKTAQQIDDAP